jgi:hypothetical protein
MNFAVRAAATASLTLLGILLSGCVTSTVQQVREANTGMLATDSIVVLGRRTRPSSAETELDFVSCVSKNVSSGRDKLNVIREQDFLDALFPWFEPRTAPVHTTDLPQLINQAPLAQRLNEIGLRYVVWIDGTTRRTESSGSLTCSVTAAGAGCFGFLTWENDSSYEASIWDVRTGASVGKISSDAVGTSYMPAVVVPLPFIAPVRSSACSTMGGQLKAFLMDNT